jgi:hypothetical protein
MAFVIDRFGTLYASATELPTLDGSQPQGAGPVESSLIRLPGGGAYDWRGSEQAQIGPTTVLTKGVWVESTVALMETKLAALKALVGTRNRLWRTNGVRQDWRWARLLEVRSDLEAGFAADALIEMRFEALPGVWMGSGRLVNAILDASPKTAVCTNSGNARVTHGIVTITAAGSVITQVKVAVSGVSEIQWTGTLAVGASLVIDCGARTIRNAGADAYAGFALTANHLVTDWLRLEAGANSVVISRTGGSTASAAAVNYNDGWA